MVFDEPPAPAAREEFGLDTWAAPAARLLRPQNHEYAAHQYTYDGG